MPVSLRFGRSGLLVVHLAAIGNTLLKIIALLASVLARLPRQDPDQ
jgi:hypothetical protein